MRSVVLIAHNLRSSHNVGSLLRTAEGLGVERVYLTGYTPYPAQAHDTRMPHIARKVNARIHKTALGAETLQKWKHEEDIATVFARLKRRGFAVWALEQTPEAIAIASAKPPTKIALVVGRETEGIERDVLNMCDAHIEIPMSGQKESFNVAQAAAIGLYQLIHVTAK